MAERYGDFELQRLIATGGMAEIYLAKHGGFGGFSRTVVVKRMLPQLAVRPDFVQMFLDEARLAANLNHPNIVQVFNLGEVDQSYFIAMEFVDGPHLGSLFAHSLRLRRPLPIELCAYVVARSADGLHYAHEQADPATGEQLNIVHRDISPQNILVSRQGDVKVTDFGVAKASTQQTKTRTGIIKGKVAYMSPEQCLGEIVDRRTDVFALGIVLYELLTRRRLFRDKSDLLIMQKITGEDVQPPSAVNKELDAELDAICARALARDRDARFSTAAELSEALDAWLTTHSTGDPRLQLQKWFEQNALELSIHENGDPSSPSVATAQVRPAGPGEATAATPSLNSLETVMRPSDASGPTRRPAAGDTLAFPARSSPGVLPLPERPLPERAGSNLADEPTQRAMRPAMSSESGPAGVAPGREATIQMRADDLVPPPASGARDAVPLHGTTTGSVTVPPRAGTPVAAIVGGGLVGAAVLAAVLVLVGRGGKDGDTEGGTNPPVVGPTDPRPTDPSGGVAKGTARVVVESVPSGVAILLDDERVVGKTPLTLDHAPGSVKLQAQFADQPPLNETIEVAAGEERVVRLFAKVPLTVKSTPGKAKVRVNGELLGETPFEKLGLISPEKPVKLKLELAGYQTFEKELTPEPGAPLVVDAPLVKIEQRPSNDRVTQRPPPAATFGFLNMRSTPWVNVKLQSGGSLGATILAQARVPSGRQVLVLTNPEQGISDTLTVTIPEEKPLSVTLEWEKKGDRWRIKTKSIK